MVNSRSKRFSNANGNPGLDHGFGKKLREYRKNAGMTLAGLAEQAGKLGGVNLSPSGLHNLETGKTLKRPAREMVQGLAFALGLPPTETQLLLEAAGYRTVPEPLLDQAQAALRRALRASSPADAEIL